MTTFDSNEQRRYTVNGWTIYKEFYADGPSLFNWIAEGPDGEYEEFRRRKDAFAYVRSLGNGGGDCYEAAVLYALTIPEEDRDRYRVVHGQPTGTGGEIVGLKHGHAWVERQDSPPTIDLDSIPAEWREQAEFLVANTPSETWITVIDKSNGKDVEWSRTVYYGIGRIDPAECRYYTIDEALKLTVKFEHYGSWPEVSAP